MLTKTGINKILTRIMETGGFTDDMEKDIRRLKDELDERDAILKKYGEVYDGEDKDEYEYVEREYKDYKAEYDALKERYMKRFFGETIEDDRFEDETVVDETVNDTNYEDIHISDVIKEEE